MYVRSGINVSFFECEVLRGRTYFMSVDLICYGISSSIVYQFLSVVSFTQNNAVLNVAYIAVKLTYYI